MILEGFINGLLILYKIPMIEEAFEEEADTEEEDEAEEEEEKGP